MSPAARLAGVIGWPVGHSLSPRIHNFWLRALHVDGAYMALPVERDEFSRVVDSLRHAGFAGINVTLPHKQAAFAISDVLDGAAQITGAVNLLLFEADGGIEGRNTDVEGLRASLVEEFGESVVAGRVAVVLGAGGAARAATLALNALGATEIRIVNRNTERAQNLVEPLQSHLKSRLVPMPWSASANAARDVALLVNATSAGMRGAPALDLSLEGLTGDAVVYDLVYNPLETELLKRARASGHTAASGLGMLLHQAVPSFAAFYGTTPQITPELRGELEQALTT